MKIIKGSLGQIINLFGEEGILILSEYPDLPIIFAETGDYAECDRGNPALVIANITEDYSTISYDGRDPLALIIYENAVNEVIDRVPPDLSDRFRTSMLVHELTHVRQVQEGRLEIVDEKTNIWEGEVVVVDFANYFSLPWEKEAFFEQYLYLFNGDEATAQAVVDEQCKQIVNI